MSTVTDDVRVDFQDYYEVLQLSPKADADTIGRVYRILVKRYHPDNQNTGNAEKFRQVMDACRVLTDAERRAAYDSRYEENRASIIKVFDEASSSDSFDADRRILEGILSLLYMSRRRDPARGGMGTVQLERLLRCPAEHLDFHLWYLREKGLIQRLDSGLIAITVDGVDKVIAQGNVLLRRDRLITEKAEGTRRGAPHLEFQAS